MSRDPNQLAPAGVQPPSRFSQWAARVAMVGSVLAPVAAAEIAAYIAPPAHVDTAIAGASVTAEAVPGSNVINTNLQLVNVQSYSHIRAGTKDIGANITFHFNNVSLTDKQGQFNSARIQAISKEFSDLRPEVMKIQDTMSQHYETWAGGGALAVLGLEVVGRAYYLRRKHERSRLSPADRRTVEHYSRHSWPALHMAIGAVTIGLPIAGAALYLAPNHPQAIHADHNLDGTRLEGFGISGPAKPAADYLIPESDSFFREKNGFYDDEARNFATSFKTKYGVNTLQKTPGQKRIILVDDFQGEDGPARLTGIVARAYNADLVVVGGDITATGSPLETPVLDALKSSAGNIPIEASLGHHDPHAVAQMIIDRHMNLADGTVHTINDLRIEGINSPDFIPFAQTARLRGADFPNQTIEGATNLVIAKMIGDACAQTQPTIFEMHDQALATRLAQADCPNVPLILTGRQSPAHPPVVYPHSTEFISGTTGGHSSNPTIQAFSIIHAPAVIEEITINDETYETVTSDQITLEGWPSTGVTITDNMANVQTGYVVPTSISLYGAHLAIR